MVRPLHFCFVVARRLSHRLVTSDVAYGGTIRPTFSPNSEPHLLPTEGGSSFLKSGSDPTDLVEGVVAAMRLQGRLMAIPWLAPILKFSPLAAKSSSFANFCQSAFEVRFKNGNPRGGVDFLTHLVSASFLMSNICLYTFPGLSDEG